MSEDDRKNSIPTTGPTQPSYMRELAEEKAKELEAYTNTNFSKFFYEDTIRDWVRGVINNGDEWGLPNSPLVYRGEAQQQLFGWIAVLIPVGALHDRNDILMLLDEEYRRANKTDTSLWDQVNSVVRELCGLDAPETPSQWFGKEILCADLHRLDGRVNRAVRRYQQQGSVGKSVLDSLYQFQTRDAGHLEV